MKFVALHDQLVCSTDQIQLVDPRELFCRLRPEQISSSSGADCPVKNILRV